MTLLDYQVQGLQAMCGVSALHSPYCHDQEVRDRSIALYGNGALGFGLCVFMGIVKI